MEKNSKKNKIEAFLERNELKIGQLFEVSIPQNPTSYLCFVSKSYDLTTKLPFFALDEKTLYYFLNPNNTIKKVNFLKNPLLLLYIDEVHKGNIDDSSFQGIRLQKGGIFYTIMYYDSPSKSGMLLRETDNKLILVINFPKNGKVTWNEKGEFNTDTSGIEECKEAYRTLIATQGATASTSSVMY